MFSKSVFCKVDPLANGSLSEYTSRDLILSLPLIPAITPPPDREPCRQSPVQLSCLCLQPPAQHPAHSGGRCWWVNYWVNQGDGVLRLDLAVLKGWGPPRRRISNGVPGHSQHSEVTGWKKPSLLLFAKVTLGHTFHCAPCREGVWFTLPHTQGLGVFRWSGTRCLCLCTFTDSLSNKGARQGSVYVHWYVTLVSLYVCVCARVCVCVCTCTCGWLWCVVLFCIYWCSYNLCLLLPCMHMCQWNVYTHPRLYESLYVCGSIHSNTSFHSVSILSLGTCLSMEMYDDWGCVCFLHKSVTCVNPCECTRHACRFWVRCIGAS